MKHKLLLFTFLLGLAFAGVQAQVITADRAKAIANSFFTAGVQKSGAARGVSSGALTQSYDSNTLLGESVEAPTFHVIANPGGGFVIVSGEEVENPIIGYSFDNEFAADGVLSDGLADYLKDIDAQVRALREYNAENPQKVSARSATQKASYATSMGNIVRELKTASWDQGAPFNNLCFTAAGKQALTGCVPTAYAILCHYYKWPVAATGEGYHSDTGEIVTFGQEYDYENMLYDYSKGYNDAQATAVATLMRDLGYAYQVAYGEGDTPSVLKGEGAAVLINQFGFKSLSTTHTSNTYATTKGDDATWVSLIKNSLDQNHPIPYSAYNPNSGGRHIFVLDGYTDNGYYHFNFGWGGDGNGWFTLNNVAPTNYNQYTQSHKAYFELIPDRQAYIVAASVSSDGAGLVSINGGEAGIAVEGEVFAGANVTLSATANNGYVFSHWSKDGAVVSSDNPYVAKVTADDELYVANFVAGVSCSVEVSAGVGGTASKSAGVVPENSSVTLTAVASDGYAFVGWYDGASRVSTDNPYTFVVTGDVNYTAMFEEVEEPVTPPVTPGVSLGYEVSSFSGTVVGDPSASWAYNSGYQGAEYTAPLTMKALAPQGVEVGNIDVLSSGKLSLIACSAISNNQQLSTTYTVAVPEASGYKITGYSIESTAYRDLVVTHNGRQVSVSKGEGVTLSGEGLDVCSLDVVVAVSRYDQSAALDIESFVVYVEYASGSTAIEDVETETVGVKVIYDLSGRRVEKITNAGIYIVNGKKILVK